MKIAILGAGAFGTALGGILAFKGYDIDYYDSKLERENLNYVLDKAKYIVLCVPSKAAPFLLPCLPDDKPLIVATKGILTDTMLRGFKDWMVLSGPGFADDIKAKKKTFLTATDSRIVDLFNTDYIQFDFTDDRRGVLMCGALKNIYAILAGLKALQRETSAWRQFIKQVTKEMGLILEANGAESDTVELMCGVGDLKLTCGLPSRNYEYGSILRENPAYEASNTVEGLSAIRRILRHEIVVPAKAQLLKEVINAVKQCTKESG